MKILIYDSIYSNHLKEYLDIIIEYFDKKKEFTEIHFILSRDFLNKYEIDLKNRFTNVDFIFIPLSEKLIDESNCRNFFNLNSFSEYNYIRNYCYQHKINKVFLLYLDYFQLSLVIAIKSNLKWPVEFYGLLFSTFFYQRKFSFRKLYGWIKLKFLIRNKELKYIFVLNNRLLVDELNHKFNSNLFIHLPDPVLFKKVSNTHFLKSLNFKSDDLIFAVLGRITKRKNVHRIIKAFDLLPDYLLNRVKLVICGSFDDLNYKTLTLNCISDKLINKIFIKDSFINDEEFEEIIYASDFICTAYNLFFGSSGIVGKAACHRKLVLASHSGTIGQLIKNYKLGVTVDDNSVFSIAQGILELLLHHNEFTVNAKFEEYCLDNSPEAFSHTLLRTFND